MEEFEALCDRVAIVDGGAIVAVGKVTDLIAQHAGRGIEVELAGARDPIDAAEHAAAGHGSVARDGGLLRSAFDGYNRGLHWERTCAGLSKLRITRGPRDLVAEQPIAASGDRIDPWLVTVPAISGR